MPLGSARLTSAGRLPHKGIIHVAGINLLWRSSEHSVKESVRNAICIAKEQDYRSVAFPLIGAGSGGAKTDLVQNWISEALNAIEFDGKVAVVKWNKSTR